MVSIKKWENIIDYFINKMCIIFKMQRVSVDILKIPDIFSTIYLIYMYVFLQNLSHVYLYNFPLTRWDKKWKVIFFLYDLADKKNQWIYKNGKDNSACAVYSKIASIFILYTERGISLYNSKGN